MKKTLTFLIAAAGLLAMQQSSRAAVPCDRTELGDKIKDNSRIYLSTSHPSGISDPGSTARQNIIDTADGKKARTSGYSDVGVTYVWLHPNLLDCMDRLEGVYGYSYSVSEIAGGDHSSSSYHYSGTAFDVYTINGSGVSSGNPYWSAFNQRCRDMGSIESLGPGYPGHDTHVHNAWSTSGNGDPVGCVNNKDHVHTYVRGGDGACWTRSWDSGSGWNNWYSLGGNITGGPDAYSRNSGHVAVVIRSATEVGHIKQNVWSGSWGGWSDLWTSAGGNMTSDPSATARGTDNVHIFARGPNGDCMKRSWNATTGWAAWASEGGSISGAPDSCSKSASHLYISVLSATDVGHIKGKTWTASGGWGGWVDIWTSVGGNMDSAPSVVARGDTKMHVFARKGGSIWIRTNTDGSGWAEWYSLGAPGGSNAVGDPDSYSRGPDHVAVVVRNQYNNLWKKTWTQASGWGSWGSLDAPTGGVTASPGAVAR